MRQGLKPWRLVLETLSRYKPDRENKVLKIAIMPVGQVDIDVLRAIQDGLKAVLPETESAGVEKPMQLTRQTYNAARKQHHSTQILSEINRYAEKVEADYILGVTKVDLYVPNYNFVFGEAGCPGRVALVSLCRLKPEFHGAAPNKQLFQQRALKEAVHEIGHALGLEHCKNPFCVMFFSLSIEDTDKKGVGFCDDCHLLVHRAMEK